MTTKTFDSVKLMRELRARISQEMENMTPEERILYVRKMASSTALGRTLAGQAAAAVQPDNATDDPSERR